MIAVVFSGSRFANWRLANRGKIVSGFRTSGFNPNLHDERYIIQNLNKCNDLINHAEKIKKIFFFGAGTSTQDKKEKLTKIFENFFVNAKVFIEEDIQGSAIATSGDHNSIIGILGSGSNAGYYNGKKVNTKNYGLGYILADEGSSNWIGRMLLKSFLTNKMPQDLKETFESKHSLDKKLILDKIYNNPNPDIFLTSFTDFVSDNKEHPFIKEIITEGMELFLKNYIIPLQAEYTGVPVNFTGSIAAQYEDILRKTAKDMGVEINTVIEEPITKLLEYHIKK